MASTQFLMDINPECITFQLAQFIIYIFSSGKVQDRAKIISFDSKMINSDLIKSISN